MLEKEKETSVLRIIKVTSPVRSFWQEVHETLAKLKVGEGFTVSRNQRRTLTNVCSYYKDKHEGWDYETFSADKQTTVRRIA